MFFFGLFLVLAASEANRESFFPAFLDWLHSNGVDTSAIEIKEFTDVGFGLKASRDLKVSTICF